SCTLSIGASGFGRGFGTCVAGGGCCDGAVCAQRSASKSIATTSKSGIPTPVLSATIFPWSLLGSEFVDTILHLSFENLRPSAIRTLQGESGGSPPRGESAAPDGGEGGF